MLKKVKHRLVENMSSGTADALGLSRAILCNGESSSFQPDSQLSIKLTSLPQPRQPSHTFVSLGSSSSLQELLCQLWALGHCLAVGRGQTWEDRYRFQLG